MIEIARIDKKVVTVSLYFHQFDVLARYIVYGLMEDNKHLGDLQKNVLDLVLIEWFGSRYMIKWQTLQTYHRRKPYNIHMPLSVAIELLSSRHPDQIAEIRGAIHQKLV